MGETDSRLVRFYAGLAPDDRGRTLADLQALGDDRMEYYHDFIQWLFPLRDRSAYNPGAPVLTDADVRAFHGRPELRAALRASFLRFLKFVGLEFDDAAGAVRDADGLDRRRRAVFTAPNHNWLRITRVLLSLNALGLPDEARAFFAYLDAAHRRGVGITADTFAYWSDAARGVVR